MRRIILQSDIHKYDVRLCHFKDAYDGWASQYFQNYRDRNDPIPVEVHPQSSAFSDHLTANTLSERQVWDVVARWHGLALLHDLYCHPSINSAYRQSAIPYLHVYNNRSIREGDPLLEEQKLLLEEELHSAPEIIFRPLVTPSCGVSTKERFYMALTGYWLAIEGLRFANICQYPLQSIENMIYDKVDALWMDGRSLHESFDMLEVYDFVYGYLLRQTEPAGFNAFTQWIQDEWFFPNDRVEGHWDTFVQNMRLILSPADVIELLIFTSQWKHPSKTHLEWSSDGKKKYLRLRSFFDESFRGQVTVCDVNSAPDKWYHVEDLERAVELKLRIHLGDQEHSSPPIWTDYRRTKWETDARGTALFWGISDKVIVDRIKSPT